MHRSSTSSTLASDVGYGAFNRLGAALKRGWVPAFAGLTEPGAAGDGGFGRCGGAAGVQLNSRNRSQWDSRPHPHLARAAPSSPAMREKLVEEAIVDGVKYLGSGLAPNGVPKPCDLRQFRDDWRAFGVPNAASGVLIPM